MPSGDLLDDETPQDVGQLLRAWLSMGAAFEPDTDGWRVSYVLYDRPERYDYELTAGQLSNAYSRGIAAKTALKPLVEPGGQAEANSAKRDGLPS